MTRDREQGRRRLLAGFAYAVLLVVYVGLGLAAGTLVLNWIVGPLFPVLALHVTPRLVRRMLGGAVAEP